jgi:Na+/phosphate symporter
MKPEEFQETTTQILANLSDQGKVSDYLSQLVDVYKTTHTTNQTLTDEQTKHQKEIQALKETNMNLFLKVQSPDSQTNQTHTQNENNLTYDKLVSEMGGTK